MKTDQSALVTGAAGFVGFRITLRLLELGLLVDVLDEREPARAIDLSLVRSAIRGSVLDRKSIDQAIENVDVVFHLAARVGVQYVLGNPLSTLDSNVMGTRNVVEACARSQKRLVFTSSSEVYGHPDRVPVREDDERQLGPTSITRWSYADSKAMGESYAHAYRKEHGLDFTIARLFNTVGPGQTGAYGMVVPRMVKQALAGDPITVFGDGSQTRCFCHVDDVVRALIDLSESDDAIGATVNVGSQDEISILDLAHRIKDVLGSSSKTTFVPYDEAYGEGFAETYRRVPDTSRIESLIGWRPEKTLDDIIVDVAEYLRLNPDA